MAAARRSTFWFDDPDPSDRRRWTVPAGHGRFGDIEVEYLDLQETDERSVLIEAEHPELARAIERGNEEILQHGQAINPELHLQVHQIVQTRLWDDEPPEMWETAQRLTRLGYGRHVVLHMLMNVVSDELYAALTANETLPTEEVRRRLDALPAGWPAPGSVRAH